MLAFKMLFFLLLAAAAVTVGFKVLNWAIEDATDVSEWIRIPVRFFAIAFAAAGILIGAALLIPLVGGIIQHIVDVLNV